MSAGVGWYEVQCKQVIVSVWFAILTVACVVSVG